MVEVVVGERMTGSHRCADAPLPDRKGYEPLTLPTNQKPNNREENKPGDFSAAAQALDYRRLGQVSSVSIF